MPTGFRKSGEFCWINMITPQPTEACAFFGKLLGWTYGDIPGLGYSVKVEGHDIGGLFDQNHPTTPPGTPAYIGVMVKVDNADAVAAKVISLGGQAKPAFDIMDAGRMAVCFDPNGAEFDVWQPKKMLGTDVDSTLPGAPSWFETLTNDADRAAKFYTELFGWTPEEFALPGKKYTTFKLDGAPVAGMLQMTPEMGKIPPHWGTYFTVKDADAAARQAVELGGKICVPAMDVPGVGRFCGIISPHGVVFYAIHYTG
jgi:uncharacterized protein